MGTQRFRVLPATTTITGECGACHGTGRVKTGERVANATDKIIVAVTLFGFAWLLLRAIVLPGIANFSHAAQAQFPQAYDFVGVPLFAGALILRIFRSR